MLLIPAWAQQAPAEAPDAPSMSAIQSGAVFQVAANQVATKPATESQAGAASAPHGAGSNLRSEHAFWDRTNLLLFSGVAVFRGLDYASTRNMQARGREEILLPDDVVNNSAGFAALEAAGAATSVGLSYWMHHAGHHKLERWISIVHIGVTGFGVVRNYSLESKHPVAPVP